MFDNNDANAGYTELTGGANPLSGLIGAADASYSAPTFVDLDGDGDLDLVVGNYIGKLRVFDNNNANAGFTELTGTANPFNDIDVSFSSAPAFVDLDEDGDLDLVVGTYEGAFISYENTTPHGQMINVAVTAETEVPTATGLPTDVTVVEDVASTLDLSAVTISDADTLGAITVVLTASAGTVAAGDNGGVTVENSGTAALTLTGTAADINAYLNNAAAIQYTGAQDANGTDAATITISADDGAGVVTLDTVNVEITAVNDAPELTGFGPFATFLENTVNATPKLLDTAVVFADAEGKFDGGSLSLSGLLAEDRMSVQNQGTGAGQVGLAGTQVTFGGLTIGTLSGGVGNALTITFNGDATSEAVNALIQNLTYANTSDAPTASRDFVLNIIDAAGADMGVAPGPTTFAPLTGADNPFTGIYVGDAVQPGFVDLDGDGDLDMVLGEVNGTIHAFENSTGGFTELLGTSNPFDGFDVGNYAKSGFVDFDSDGDLDLVSGGFSGTLRSFRNDAGVYTELTGLANPFDAVGVTNWPVGAQTFPAFADLDGDGDLDAVVGERYGSLRSFRNDAGVYTELTGAANPFNGVDVGHTSAPSFVDLDGDGDMDAVVGTYGGRLLSFRNDAGVFTALTGAENPFDGVSIPAAQGLNPTFFDVNDDGVPDAVLGMYNGTLLTYLNTTPHGQVITVNVTAEIDVILGTAGADVLNGTDRSDSIRGLGGNDVILGSAGADTLNGGAGLDWLDYSQSGGAVAVDLGTGLVSGGDAQGDTIVGFEHIFGSAFNDTLTGDDGNNMLNGGTGADALIGGLGNDTYVTDGGDTITEAEDAGTDTVQSSATHTLGANLENLMLTGSEAIDGTGNMLANVITGNSAANTLKGGGGNDTLNGGTGSDTLIGGAGNDTYVTDGGDTITEAAGAAAGIDTVKSSVTLTLGAFLENLTLTGSVAINGIGNALANTLTGNGAANILNGGTGSDTLIGGAGNDTYVTDGGDTITEAAGAGNDTVQSSVTLTLGVYLENLTLTGVAAINGIGNTQANTLTGNDGNNNLNGGAGSDTLTGGLGNDNFVFNTAPGTPNVDRITDFNAAEDTIRLEGAIFTNIGNGAVSNAEFLASLSGNAADASDRILYETDTGKIFFDSDGTGGAAKVLIAIVDPGLGLTNADFFVF